jgi:hypothetical protein
MRERPKITSLSYATANFYNWFLRPRHPFDRHLRATAFILAKYSEFAQPHHISPAGLEIKDAIPLRCEGRAPMLKAMPAKKHALTDEERAKRLRETAREVDADATQDEFERVFRKIVPPKSDGGPRQKDG